jgi:glyoxylase-like metal-dependent hydrolase (beta-lactamase superfamily II)
VNQQIPIGDHARVQESDGGGGLREVAPDLAYLRTLIANVVLVGHPAGQWVLVDAGVMGTKAHIRNAAQQRFGADARPAAIVLTHGHFDHVGVLEDLAAEWDVPVFAHEFEHPYLDGRAAYPPGDPTVGGGLMASLSALYPTRPVNVASRLQSLPADGSVPHMPGWRWIHTPGHSAGHVSFFRADDRAMIVGDAFVTTRPESAYATAVQSPELHGPPRYFTTDWQAAQRSVETLAALEPELVVCGHGLAMQGAEMRAALDELAQSFDAIAVPQSGRYVKDPASLERGNAYRSP